MTRILIVDDDRFMHDYLHHVLKPEYENLLAAETLAEGWKVYLEQQPDLVLLDLILPDGSGLELCKQIRRHDPLVPVLILTARYQVQDRVSGLEGGADDYIVKPFERDELMARILTALRRRKAIFNQQYSQRISSDKLEVAELSMHSATWDVTFAGQSLQLSKTEFKLLRLLAQHADKVLERDFLLQEVWGAEAGSSSRTIDNFVLRLRKKLATAVTAAGRQQPVLDTVYGVGYSLRTFPEPDADM